MYAHLVGSLADGQESGALDNLTTAQLFFGGIGLLIVAVVVRVINKKLLDNDSFMADIVAYACVVGGIWGVYQALVG